MTVYHWPSGKRLSLQDWAAMPEDNSHRYELVEGVLQVSPRPRLIHQLAGGELLVQLHRQLPPDLVALAEAEVVVFDGRAPTVRVPDLIVLPRQVVAADPARCRAEDVLLAVEIISPTSERTDKVVKFDEYADAGIGTYWWVDLSPPASLAAYQLIEGHYELDAETAGSITLVSPAPVTVDVPALVQPRAGS